MTCAKLIVRESDLDDVFSDMARVHLSHRPDVPAGKILTIGCNGLFVQLVARGAHLNRKGEISLDLATREKLGGLALNREYDFQLCPANWGEQIRWAWSATDPAYRVPSRISIVSLILGVFGLILGVLSFFH